MKCVTCGGPVLSGNRSGECRICREIKCAHAPCEKRVTKRQYANVYCKAHSHLRKKKLAEIEL
jgi:hypothetical protein